MNDVPSLGNRLPARLHAVCVDGFAVLIADDGVDDDSENDEGDDDETVGKLGVVSDREAEVDEVSDQHGEEGEVAEGCRVFGCE